MAKSLLKKQAEVKALSDKMRRMKVAVIAAITGLTVKDSTELRSLLRHSGIEFMVAKKTLIKRALQDLSLTGLDLDSINTSFGLAFGFDDEVLPARLLAQFAKTHPSLTFLGGVIEGRFVDASKVSELSSLPSGDELRRRVVGSIAWPLAGFVRVLQGNINRVVWVLSAVNEKR